MPTDGFQSNCTIYLRGPAQLTIYLRGHAQLTIYLRGHAQLTIYVRGHAQLTIYVRGPAQLTIITNKVLFFLWHAHGSFQLSRSHSAGGINPIVSMHPTSCMTQFVTPRQTRIFVPLFSLILCFLCFVLFLQCFLSGFLLSLILCFL